MKLLLLVVSVLSLSHACYGYDQSDIKEILSTATVHVTLEGTGKGATGFFLKMPGFSKPLVATCLHCISTRESLISFMQDPNADAVKVYLRPMGSSQKKEALKIIAYHPKADLVLLESPFDTEDGLTLSQTEMTIDQEVFSMRYDWKPSLEGLSFLTGRVTATRNQHATGKPSHIYYQGDVLLTGYSGSALVNKQAEVVGVNFLAFTPFFNLASHGKSFETLHWLPKYMSLQEFFVGHMGKDQITQSDLFFEFAMFKDPFWGSDVNTIINAFEMQSERSFVSFGFSNFMLSDLLKMALAQRNITVEKIKTIDSLMRITEKAKNVFKKTLRISSATTYLDCLSYKRMLDYQTLVLDTPMEQNILDKISITCQKSISYLRQEKKSFDQLYRSGTFKSTFEEYIQTQELELAKILSQN